MYCVYLPHPWEFIKLSLIRFLIFYPDAELHPGDGGKDEKGPCHPAAQELFGQTGRRTVEKSTSGRHRIWHQEEGRWHPSALQGRRGSRQEETRWVKNFPFLFGGEGVIVHVSAEMLIGKSFHASSRLRNKRYKTNVIMGEEEFCFCSCYLNFLKEFITLQQRLYIFLLILAFDFNIALIIRSYLLWC